MSQYLVFSAMTRTAAVFLLTRLATELLLRPPGRPGKMLA